jgi:hypothetical protein
VNKEQKLEIKMFHKDQEALEYQSLVVNQETAVCNNQSIKNPEAYEILVEKQEKIEEENDDEK